jgi:hypothetical membrane protein
METFMSIDPKRLEIVKLHKKWADGLTMLWLLVVLPLFAAIYFLFEQAGLPTDERNGAFVILAVVIIVAVIWQAVGLGVARVHMIFEKIDLEPSDRTK